MTKFRTPLLALPLMLIALFPSSYAAQTPQPNLEVWPKTTQVEREEVTFYQPQVESLQKNQLVFQMALSLRYDGTNNEQYGSVKAQCRLDTDKSQNVAVCNQLQIMRFDFPFVDQSQKESLKRLQQRLEKKSFSLSLSNLSTNLHITQQANAQRQVAYKFTPPTIYVASTPTALISIDGKPQLRPLEHSTLMHVINTPFVILLDVKKGVYYIQAGSEWMQSKAIEGPWTVLTTLPQELKSVESKQAQTTDSGSTPITNLIVTTGPSTLIQLNGKPQFTPIEGTSLLYVSNTKDDVFLQVKTQNYFALISGRWYQSKSLEDSSNWHYVAANQLPQDFAHIPSNSSKAGVLSSVPNTEAAKAAVIRNQIPQTAVVRRDEAKFVVHYDGKPVFAMIPGTHKVYYGKNADQPVFRIGKTYYGNYQGVWFVSQSPLGPYDVAIQVPDAIYQIPPSSPHYNVTYSYVYGYTPEVVYVGYTPGYMGSYVYQGTVIYGTGYVYPGWVGTVYYGYPVTYGFGFYYSPYGVWYPSAHYASPLWFGAGMAVGYAIGNHHSYHGGWFGPNRYVYRRGGHNNININVHNNTNIYNSWNKKTVVNHNNIHNNVFSHNSVKSNRVQSKRTNRVNQSSHRTQNVRANAPSHRATTNNVYAAKDGNVYRNHQGKWQKNTAKGWQDHQGNHEFLSQQQHARRHANVDAKRYGEGQNRFGGMQGRGFSRREGRGRF